MSKHSNKSKISKLSRTIILIILVIVMLAILVISFMKDASALKNIAKNPNISSNEVAEENILNTVIEPVEFNEEEIPNQMGEYNVLGTIVIDKIGIVKNILDKTTDESLNLSVTKFYGPSINQTGNFCITGHNYAGTFKYLDKLDINDTFYIVDKNNSEKVTYKIYDKYTVNPTELDCLNQETNNKREVTIITCNPGGLTRLIVKAKEI